MKKTFALMILAAGLLSCAKKDMISADENAEATGVPVCFDISVAQTKASKTAWAEGDVIYVFFKGLESKYLKLELGGNGSWTNTPCGGNFVSTDFPAEKVLTAVHFPIPVDVSYGDGTFSFTSGGAPVYNYYLFETDKAYSLEGTTVTASLALKPANLVLLHVSGLQNQVSSYTFGCSRIRPVACTGVGTDGAIQEKELQNGARLSGIADSDGAIFAGRLVNPGEAVNYTFTLASDTRIYTLVRNSKTLSSDTMYNFPALSATDDNNWTITLASDLYVDLGLSVKWAKCNLGATSETDYGDYYAWGETEPKDEYSWDTYKFGKSESGPFSKYNTHNNFGPVDNKTELDPEDDVAYVKLGGKWRMPSITDWRDLMQLCSWEWTANYKESGISGIIVTGSNGKTVFFPTAGHRKDATLESNGSNGDYWSSSLYTNPRRAYYATSSSSNIFVLNFLHYRCYGLPVRPVRSN